MNKELCKHCYDYMETADQTVCLVKQKEISLITECSENNIIQKYLVENK